ncbi:MAG: cytochrome c [Deltaproteobacteria bacterium]|nr:cytochrome c [Deltaproteobacteria bacterium]
METGAEAESLGQAAKAKDGEAVIAAFQTIQTACYGCHGDFRRQFLQHFYEMR